MDITLASFIHSTVNGHLVDFLFGAITNGAAGNIVVVVSCMLVVYTPGRVMDWNRSICICLALVETASFPIVLAETALAYCNKQCLGVPAN